MTNNKSFILFFTKVFSEKMNSRGTFILPTYKKVLQLNQNPHCIASSNKKLKLVYHAQCKHNTTEEEMIKPYN